MYVAGEVTVVEQLTMLSTSCWEREKVQQDLREAVIVSQHKNKGDRLIPIIVVQNLSENQCGFRANSSKVVMIFVLRQLQEKCREQNMDLYAAFTDLTKPFDSVSRGGPWKILGKLCCPPKFLTIIQQLHEGQQGQIKHSSKLSDPFPIENSVKQGCVLVPALFAIFFGVMLRETKEELIEGICIKFRTDGSVFNLLPPPHPN